MNRPEIVSVGIVWDSERPTLEHIMDVFATLGTTLRLSDVFHSVIDSRWADTTLHSLVGVVTYYGKHYSTFFFHTKLRVWIYFDDATVREIGPRWEQVVEKCRRGRYQPLLLLYAVPNGTPVNTDHAPKQTTPFYTEKSPTKKPPSQAVLRRSITPSPEKPNIGNTRRAITPNPDCTLAQKPPLSKPYNEYQNLSVIQDNIYGKTAINEDVDVVDGDMTGRSEYATRHSLENVLTVTGKPSHIQVHRTLSNGSSSGLEGISVPDHLNIPRRRDSGNWSGDRNSASSSSSTTMENPYLYLVGKVPHGTGSTPGSPTRKCESSSGSSGVYDAGYDSYSLSSNDSSTMTTIQHLMKMGHLAKIPEDYGNPTTHNAPSCDALCEEADELLTKSRQLEDEHDLVLALALCNAAATKARAAMNAPYNNTQTLTLARMKHNTCIMRARSLHRRMTQSQNPTKESPPEIRHTREGSSGSGRHSRQNSRDKGQHSRQGSRELLSPANIEKTQAQTKNIEIYATLPKKKDVLKNKVNINIGEDEEYMMYDKPPGRESRSIFSRSKNKENKAREKRSRSEDRNKMSRDFSIAPEIFSNAKDTLKREKNREEKEEKKDKEKTGKKQHKIRRKLLMGGLIRRKNRSMPDLTEGNAENAKTVEKPALSVDDSSIGMKGTDNISNMCGYLSEGHLEFSGNSTNPNLERSRLMRKSFHGSAGKVLIAAKVPPPPPLRTTSQLSTSKLISGEVCDEKSVRPQYPLPMDAGNPSHYQNGYRYGCDASPNNSQYNEPISLQYLPVQNQTNQRSQQDHTIYYQNRSPVVSYNTVVTRADVHQEQSPIKQEPYPVPYINQPQFDSGVDEVDCLASPSYMQSLDLPPYPSPVSSVIHSRQASEDFPPPPPPLDLSSLDEHLNEPVRLQTGTLLSALQNKRQEILSQENQIKRDSEPSKASGGTWLKELQAKQAALRMKKNPGCDDSKIDNQDLRRASGESGKLEGGVKSSVKDLASRFENINIIKPDVNIPVSNNKMQEIVEPEEKLQINNNLNNVISDSTLRFREAPDNIQAGVLSLKKREDFDKIAPKQIAEEIREVEMLNAVVQKAYAEKDDIAKKNKPAKKKSVSFCDQVTLVEEQEDDSYIPNPILERVLRTAMNKTEAAAIREEIITLRESGKGDTVVDIQMEPINNVNEQVPFVHQQQILPVVQPQLPQQYINPDQIQNQGMYVRQNSLDNLLSRSLGTPTIKPDYVNGLNEDTRFQHVSNHDSSRSAQIYGTSPQTPNQPCRYSPYQTVPSPNGYPTQTAYPNRPHLMNNSPINYNQDYNYQQYSVSPRNYYGPTSPHLQNQVVRQSPVPVQAYNPNYPSPTNQSPYNQIPPQYQHPPSPSPSTNSYSTSPYSQQLIQNRPPLPQQTYSYNMERQYNPYQRVPPPSDYPYNNPSPNNPVYQKVPALESEQTNYAYNSPYQRLPQPANINQAEPNGSYQRVPYQDPYQRVPNPNVIEQNLGSYQQVPTKISPYHHVLPSKQALKKTVSFEPGTKGGTESPTPKAVVTPIIVNNVNSNVNSSKIKCNLCRKKYVIAPNLYCADCEFYMSRFKPKS